MGQNLKPPVAPLEVTLKEDKSLQLRDLAKGGEQTGVTLETLAAEVKARQEANPEQAVVIAADKDSRYEEVLKVMDILQRAQVKKVGLLAKPGNF